MRNISALRSFAEEVFMVSVFFVFLLISVSAAFFRYIALSVNQSLSDSVQCEACLYLCLLLSQKAFTSFGGADRPVGLR
jgi:hypothetical protein